MTTFTKSTRDLAPTLNGHDMREGEAALPPVLVEAVDLQNHALSNETGTIPADHPREGHEFRRVVSELRPRWVVVENVPGLLSSNGGADFGVVLRGLGDLGYGWAYRVLDARWFGVPQRRRRVFVVGCLGDARRAAQVLAVCESCGGHPPTRGEAREDVAYALAASARGTGDGHGNAWNSNYVAATLKEAREDVAYTLAGGSPETSRRIGNGWNTTYLAMNNGQGEPNIPAGFYLHRGQANDTAYTPDGSPPLMGSARNMPGVSETAGVRRLTPLECERLQGFPDGWTDVRVDGKLIADAHRYRMLGNAVATVVAQWLGHRLVWVDRL